VYRVVFGIPLSHTSPHCSEADLSSAELREGAAAALDTLMKYMHDTHTVVWYRFAHGLTEI